MRRSIIALAALLLTASNSFALGECGLSCCLAGATTSGAMNAKTLGVSVQYEDMYMETIKNGTGEVHPNEVIDRHWTMGSSYSVPLEMKMKKVSLILAKPVTERLQLLAIVPWVSNDMKMRMKSAMGMTMDMTMDTVEGLGDVSVIGFYTLDTDAPIRPTRKLTLGVGVKTPTGKNDVKKSNGKYVHAMMQPGSGSWDPLFMVNYMRAWYPLVVQANLFYHWTTEGDEGYEFGDQFSYDLIMRYQVSDYVNIGVDLNGIHAEKDKDRRGNYSSSTSMPDNTENTGLDSLFISPTVQWKVPNSGGSMEVKYQVPLRQDVDGYQQVVDWRLLASASYAF